MRNSCDNKSVIQSIRQLFGKRMLITGDVGTGKTRLTLKLVEEAIEIGLGSKITVVDMAPASAVARGLKVGGRLIELSQSLRNVRYLAPKMVKTPRLSAKSADELRSLVRLNSERIRPLLEKYVREPTPILFVNDISIYLQSGDIETVQSAMRASETFIANGYCGTALEPDFGTGVSETERRLMEEMAENSDVVVRL